MIYLCIWQIASTQPLNNHLQFDGVDDYISLNNMDIAGNQLTLEALINSSNLSNCHFSQCRIISKTTSPTPSDHYWMLSTDSTNGNNFLRFRVKTGGTTTSLVATLGALSNNTWYHVAATYDGANMKLFLNGNQVGSTPKTGTLNTDPTVEAWIGGNPPTDNSHPWYGGIDEVRIWNTARTQIQLQDNRNKEIPPNEPGLQAYYRFNEGTGQTINDYTGNNNTVLGSTSSSDVNDPTFADPNPPNQLVTVNLQAMLEGAFDPGQNAMTGELLNRGIVPQGQPYGLSPWNYPGIEGSGWLPVDYPVETVDWVLVSLRETLDPETEIARAATILLKDGSIVPFDITISDATIPLHVMIEHRNHLPIISAQPIFIVNNAISHNFTLGDSYNTSGFGQKQVNANWMMYAGNAAQEGLNGCDINAIDRAYWETVNGLFNVYNPGDYNMDGDITGSDMIVFSANNGIFTSIPKPIETIDTDPTFNCPSNFVLNTCTFIINWSHHNPLSTNVNYDLTINGIDAGPFVTFPTTSTAIDVCNLLGFSSGSGTFDAELFYWYGSDTSNTVSAGTCTISYDFGGTPTHAQGKTFTQIANDAPANFCDVDGDDAYIAEYLIQQPGNDVYYWNVVTLPNGEKCVVSVDLPTPPSSAIQLPAPRGGNLDDTQILEAVINSNPGRNFVGSGGTYRLNTLDINVQASIWNVPSAPVNSGTNDIWHINAPDVRIYNSPIDGQGSTGFRTGWRVEDGSHRFHLLNSGLSNVIVTDYESLSGIQLEAVDDFHIVGNTFSNLLNASGPSKPDGSPYRAPAITIFHSGWDASGHGTTSGGIIANNISNNLQSNGSNNGDSKFYKKTSFSAIGQQTKLFANRMINSGRQVFEFQRGGAVLLSNSAAWTEKTGNPGMAFRPLAAMVVITNGGFFVSDNVFVRNNRFKVEPAVGGQFERIFMMGPSLDTVMTNSHIDCNTITINSNDNGTVPHNPTVFYAAAMTTNIGYGTFVNCSIKDNIIDGIGAIEHYWHFTNGLPSHGWPAVNLELSGNVFTIPWTVAEYE